MKQREHPFLIVTEGEDEEGLVTALLAHLSLPACDVINAEGTGNLRDRTAAALKTPGPPVTALAIVRDADTNAAGVTQSIRNILNNLGFSAPQSPFEVGRNEKGACGYAILPDGQRDGAIEDVCLECTNCEAASVCVNQFFQCLQNSGTTGYKSERVRRKAWVQTYLAARGVERVVHRAGLGFLRGHFDLDSPSLSALRTFLHTLLRPGA